MWDTCGLSAANWHLHPKYKHAKSMQLLFRQAGLIDRKRFLHSWWSCSITEFLDSIAFSVSVSVYWQHTHRHTYLNMHTHIHNNRHKSCKCFSVFPLKIPFQNCFLSFITSKCTSILAVRVRYRIQIELVQHLFISLECDSRS